MNAVLFQSSSNFMIFTCRIWSHILLSPLFWFYFLSQKFTWVFLILQFLLLLQPFYWRNAKITQWHKYYLDNFVKKFKNTPWRLLTARKMTLSNKAFSLVTFTEEILNEKLHFLCNIVSRDVFKTLPNI